jgi:hypothetical protein
MDLWLHVVKATPHVGRGRLSHQTRLGQRDLNVGTADPSLLAVDLSLRATTCFHRDLEHGLQKWKTDTSLETQLRRPRHRRPCTRTSFWQAAQAAAR